MFDGIAHSFDAMTRLPWPAIVSAAASVAIAAIAFNALKSWKRQDKAKRQAEFLDHLTDAAHAYIAEMSKPVTVLQFVTIGMESHAPTWEGDDRSIKGAIAYIEKRGAVDSKRLFEALAAAQPSAIRLRSLVAKGQVFKFEGYAKCQNAVKQLTWHFDRLEALTVFISLPSWNWEKPEVLSHLENLMEINTDDIRECFAKANVSMIEFVAESYGRIYD